jgi:hypothetical protein
MDEWINGSLGGWINGSSGCGGSPLIQQSNNPTIHLSINPHPPIRQGALFLLSPSVVFLLLSSKKERTGTKGELTNQIII